MAHTPQASVFSRSPAETGDAPRDQHEAREGGVRNTRDVGRVLDGARMVESRAREEDAFERAAAQLRPDWAGDGASPGQAAADGAIAPAPTVSVGAAALPTAPVQAPVLNSEPSVIVQPDIAHATPGASGIDPHSSLGHTALGYPAVAFPQRSAFSGEGAFAGEAASPTDRPSAPMASGFGVASAFSAPGGSGAVTPSHSTRHEATVVTNPLSLSALRALGFGLPDPAKFSLDGARATDDAIDEAALAAAKRARSLRMLVIGAAACVLLGVLIALFSGGKSEPVAVAPPSAPAVVAPVVQPLPASSPAAPSKPVSRVAIKSSDKPAASAPVVKKAEPATAVRRAQAAQPVVAKKKLVPAAKAPARPAAKIAKAPVKAPAKGKGVAKGKAQPQPATKRARSPIDVLNPWAN